MEFWDGLRDVVILYNADCDTEIVIYSDDYNQSELYDAALLLKIDTDAWMQWSAKDIDVGTLYESNDAGDEWVITDISDEMVTIININDPGIIPEERIVPLNEALYQLAYGEKGRQ